jgi:tetratricopeptide (TPR) repeat protein
VAVSRERASGRLKFTLAGYSTNIFCLMFSPDGRRLATASDDRTIKLWDTTTGYEVFTLRGHTAGVPSVAFTADGNRIVSGGEDGRVRVWDGAPLSDDVLGAHEARFERERGALAAVVRAADDLQRAEVLATNGQLDRALDIVGSAIALKPDNVQLRRKRADFLAAAGRWRDAADALGATVALEPGDTSIRQRHHVALLKAGDFAGYERAASEMLGREFNAGANEVAWPCVLGPLPDAVRDIPVRLVESVAADQANALNTLGVALYRAGRFEEAIKRLDERVRINNVPEDWAFLAMAHHRLGNYDEPRRWLAKLGPSPSPPADFSVARHGDRGLP